MQPELWREHHYSQSGPAVTVRTPSLRRTLVEAEPGRSFDRRLRTDRLAEARTERARRILNILVAAAGLILSFPLMVLIAVAIKLTSPGPIFYVQTRVGLDRRQNGDRDHGHRRRRDLGGKPFRIYKFRTMRGDGSSCDAQTWASPGDCRVTPLGRFLRKYRLDELPQLVNVLRGDMNVVGPRPEQPEIFGRLREEIGGDYTRRQAVMPGITGWAQIHLHYDRSVDDVRRKLELDLEYIHRRSLGKDLMIMTRTIPVMVLKRGGW